MSAHTFTAAEELRLILELVKGDVELTWAVFTFYATCAANGLYSGWVIGNWMIVRSPWS